MSGIQFEHKSNVRPNFDIILNDQFSPNLGRRLYQDHIILYSDKTNPNKLGTKVTKKQFDQTKKNNLKMLKFLYGKKYYEENKNKLTNLRLFTNENR